MKYHLARGEEQLGTFNDLDVSAGLRSGRFLPADLCWTEGMEEWQTLEARMQALAAESGVEAVPPAMAVEALREEVRRDRAAPRAGLASLGQRLAAAMIDLFLVAAPLVAMFSLVIDEKFKTDLLPIQEDPQAVAELLQRRLTELSTTGSPALELLSWLMIALMVATMVLLTVRGQSIGKLLLGIHIVRNSDEGRAGFVKAVLLRTLLFGIIGNLRLVGPFFLIADVLLIFRQDRRCLHDLVADTKVVRRQARSDRF